MDHMKFPCLPLSEIDLFSTFSVFFRPEYIFPIGDFGPDPVFPIGVFRPDPDYPICPQPHTCCRGSEHVLGTQG